MFDEKLLDTVEIGNKSVELWQNVYGKHTYQYVFVKDGVLCRASYVEGETLAIWETISGDLIDWQDVNGDMVGGYIQMNYDDFVIELTAL